MIFYKIPISWSWFYGIPILLVLISPLLWSELVSSFINLSFRNIGAANEHFDAIALLLHAGPLF